MTLAVETTGLSKAFRKKRVVSDLAMRVPTGAVYGFLGPNGSGKTTTIRMLLGLIHPTEGTATVLGQPVTMTRADVLHRVGSLVEGPAFHPYLSGRANLARLDAADSRADSSTSMTRIDAALDRVGLLPAARKKFRIYSLGMKQRLAIAATLMKDPEIFIFDEPTNGLDPSGIHEIRETMRSLGASGKTVLVSSHILHEIEQIADTVTIIGRGRLLAEGRVADILGQGTASLRVGVRDVARAAEILSIAGMQVIPGEGSLVVTAAQVSGEQVSQLLGEQGVWVNELVSQRPNLEQMFLELTAQEHLTTTQSRGGKARREKNS